MKKRYYRNCPECGKELSYSTEWTRNNAEKNKTKCSSCGRKNIPRKKESSLKASNSMKNKIVMHKDGKEIRVHINKLDEFVKLGYKRGVTEKHKLNNSKSKKGKLFINTIIINNSINEKRIYPNELKKYLNEGWQKGWTNDHLKHRSECMKGKKWSKEVIEKRKNSLKNTIKNTDYKKHLSDAMKKSYKENPEIKEKISRTMKNHCQKKFKKFKNFQPNFNPYACKIFDVINTLFNWNGQHALNGGEKVVSGYYLDFYEPNLNLVIEFDEKQHFDSNNNLINKDIKRQKRIKNELNCQFLRIDGRDINNLKFHQV